MLFDTDILIWFERGNTKAAGLIDETEERHISIFTYMEFLQGARSEKQIQVIKNFLSQYNFEVLPLTENIGHRASIYIEEYGLTTGIRVGDALIAATAIENNQTLASSNQKHFKQIKDLALHIFRP